MCVHTCFVLLVLDLLNWGFVLDNVALHPAVPRLGSGRAGADDIESQYKRIYEERVNPFTDFNRWRVPVD